MEAVAARETKRAEAAEAALAQANRQLAAPSRPGAGGGSALVRGSFDAPGPLGLKFQQCLPDAGGPAAIKIVNPGSMAAEQRHLVPGLVLTAVGGTVRGPPPFLALPLRGVCPGAG
jgi:hypothetical protein